MKNLLEKVDRGLDAISAGMPLARLVDKIIRDYPDPYELAREQATQILLRRTGKAIDPRFVWWHQFQGTATSSPRTFTGWQHSGRPSKSLRLPQLVIERFDPGFQEASDELNVYGGFYRQGPHAGRFDEHNEVPMLPSDVLADLWALDFASLYRQRVDEFWVRHGRHFRVLAKINLLAQARHAAQAGKINSTQWAQLRALVTDRLSANELPALARLEHDSSQRPLKVYRYAFDHDDRGCLYSLHEQNGRAMLYLPWAEQALWAFESERAMAGWLRTSLQDPQWLGQFMRATHLYDDGRVKRIHGQLHNLAQSASAEAAQTLLQPLKRPVKNDFFDYMANLSRAEMHSNANLMISNQDLRKVLWRGYLGAFLKVFGGFAPLGRPVLWVMLGVTVSRVALEVDAALDARDDDGRKAALRAAMIDTLMAALNLVDVMFQASFDSLAYQAPQHEATISLEHWQVQTSATTAAEGLETNNLLVGETGREGRLAGVLVQEDGSCWIKLNGLSYRVRYSTDLSCWLIVPAENPYAFGPLRPVRLSASGEWELLVPPRLAGGNPPAIENVATVNSPFWDTYAGLDSAQSKALSTQALRRQKALLESWMLPTLSEGRAPDVDANGLDCVMVRNAPEYSYRHEREYFNSLIEYYTSDESQVNDVFRHGRYRYGDEDSYIANLADSLERLPKSNAVTLYRGGNAARHTGAAPYRTGRLKVGDTLVTTDLTSFTENPYKAAEFASRVLPGQGRGNAREFDDSSVIYQLPAGRYEDGTPVSAFSLYWDEAETLFLPGQYFRVENVEQVYGAGYHFILVTLGRTVKPASGVVHDLRTGQVFDPGVFSRRLRTPALAKRFFPA
ncbi:dermonecrotic toxin domain-containing protein [Pseudomonas sp. NBRC 111119]|uniref:dermonecrotic toxin domain-containing protein n=1 Tax=Pseudomonas sp. NBRC 111119 TaxID=1661034 RepID=UPI000761D6FF|nr:DUF6543 domain-containing protein [Pseudomonas sp. NBRC 111119]